MIYLKRTYFAVCHTINCCMRALARIWRCLISIFSIIRKTIDAIGYSIVWFISTVFIFLKYSLIFTSVLSFLILLIGSILGFKMPIYLLFYSGTGFTILFILWIGKALGRSPYHYEDW